jgi:hypothetical protein
MLAGYSDASHEPCVPFCQRRAKQCHDGRLLLDANIRAERLCSDAPDIPAHRWDRAQVRRLARSSLCFCKPCNEQSSRPDSITSA